MSQDARTPVHRRLNPVRPIVALLCLVSVLSGCAETEEHEARGIPDDTTVIETMEVRGTPEQLAWARAFSDTLDNIDIRLRAADPKLTIMEIDRHVTRFGTTLDTLSPTNGFRPVVHMMIARGYGLRRAFQAMTGDTAGLRGTSERFDSLVSALAAERRTTFDTFDSSESLH